MHARPDQEGDRHFRLVDDAWDKALPHWQDDIARHFDTHHWTPLLHESRSYLESLRRLMDLLEAAERDTEG